MHADASYAFTRQLRAFISMGIAATPQQIELTLADAEGVERRLYRSSIVTTLGALGLAIDIF